MVEICGDNRFELIEKYKTKLIEATNIETVKDEMAVIDSILFRFWQMGWLDKLEADVVPKSEVERLRNHVNRLKKYDEERDIKLHARLVAETTEKVAREIFEEIEDVINNIGYFDEIDFLSLKKKYTESEGKE